MSFQVLIVLTKYPIQCSICFQFTMFEPLRGQKVSGQGDSVVRVSSIQVKLLISVLVLISKIEGKIKKWKTGAKSFWSDADRSPCSSGSSCSSSVGVVLHPGLPCFFYCFCHLRPHHDHQIEAEEGRDGIYRLSGQASHIQALKQQFDNGEVELSSICF